MPKELKVPSNISFLQLPPRAPELNSQENIWQLLRQSWLSNRIFKSFDDIVDHFCYAWNTLINQPWKIMSTAKERVCLVTAFDESYEALANVILPHFRQLVERHAYEFKFWKRKCERLRGWLKIPIIQAALEEKNDFVFWLDIDALILRYDVDIRESIVDGTDLYMVWHEPRDKHWSSERFAAHFNSGVMLIKTSAWAKTFFDRVWQTGPMAHHWNDQATILHLLGYDEVLELDPDRSNVGGIVVGQLNEAWNCIPGLVISDDPIIHHYAGVMDKRLRLALLRLDAELAPLRESSNEQIRTSLSYLLGNLRNDACNSCANLI